MYTNKQQIKNILTTNKNKNLEAYTKNKQTYIQSQTHKITKQMQQLYKLVSNCLYFLYMYWCINLHGFQCCTELKHMQQMYTNKQQIKTYKLSKNTNKNIEAYTQNKNIYTKIYTKNSEANATTIQTYTTYTQQYTQTDKKYT